MAPLPPPPCAPVVALANDSPEAGTLPVPPFPSDYPNQALPDDATDKEVEAVEEGPNGLNSLVVD